MSNNIVFENSLTQKIVDFIQDIGIEVQKNSINEETFLPGILIDKGEASWLAEHFSSGGDMGVALLDWMGLSTSRNMAKGDEKIFSHMKKWIRE